MPHSILGMELANRGRKVADGMINMSNECHAERWAARKVRDVGERLRDRPGMACQFHGPTMAALTKHDVLDTTRPHPVEHIKKE